MASDGEEVRAHEVVLKAASLEMSTYILGMSLGGSLKMCLECLAINQKMSLAKLVRKEMCFECLMSTFFNRKCLK